MLVRWEPGGAWYGGHLVACTRWNAPGGMNQVVLGKVGFPCQLTPTPSAPKAFNPDHDDPLKTIKSNASRKEKDTLKH